MLSNKSRGKGGDGVGNVQSCGVFLPHQNCARQSSFFPGIGQNSGIQGINSLPCFCVHSAAASPLKTSLSQPFPPFIAALIPLCRVGMPQQSHNSRRGLCGSHCPLGSCCLIWSKSQLQGGCAVGFFLCHMCDFCVRKSHFCVRKSHPAGAQGAGTRAGTATLCGF